MRTEGATVGTCKWTPLQTIPGLNLCWTCVCVCVCERGLRALALLCGHSASGLHA